MNPRRHDERRQVPGVGREDRIPIHGQERDRGVDDVRRSGLAQEHTGSTPELRVQRAHFERRQQSRQISLPTPAAAPNLADNATVRDGHPPRQELLLDEGDCVAIPPLDCEQRACV